MKHNIPAVRCILLTLNVAISFCLPRPSRAAEPAAAPAVVFEDNFEKGADHWQPGNPAVWKVIDTPKGKAYSLFEKDPKFKTAHRSPFTYSLVKDIKVGDFVLEVDANSTVAEYAHRDLCLFFGFQDPDHYYYVHMASKTDDHANQIFIVNGKDREKISKETTAGTNWTDTYHHIRIIRVASVGLIQVYFDDMKKPIMVAVDKTFGAGQVGVGSFDDTGDFRNFKLSKLVAVEGKITDDDVFIDKTPSSK